ncbi:MAG: hypothetical protein JXA90_05685 [Planctomycetes bacterium]|nr:hypothetical protein [Planctomycetota bacterium]
MKTCPNCGHALSDDRLACAFCGWTRPHSPQLRGEPDGVAGPEAPPRGGEARSPVADEAAARARRRKRREEKARALSRRTAPRRPPPIYSPPDVDPEAASRERKRRRPWDRAVDTGWIPLAAAALVCAGLGAAWFLSRGEPEPPADETPVEAARPVAARVEGRALFDESSEPAEGAAVQVFLEGRASPLETTTDASGRFAVDGLDLGGTARVRAVVKLRGERASEYEGEGSQPARPGAENIDLGVVRIRRTKEKEPEPVAREERETRLERSFAEAIRAARETEWTAVQKTCDAILAEIEDSVARSPKHALSDGERGLHVPVCLLRGRARRELASEPSHLHKAIEDLETALRSHWLAPASEASALQLLEKELDLEPADLEGTLEWIECHRRLLEAGARDPKEPAPPLLRTAWERIFEADSGDGRHTSLREEVAAGLIRTFAAEPASDDRLERIVAAYRQGLRGAVEELYRAEIEKPMIALRQRILEASRRALDLARQAREKADPKACEESEEVARQALAQEKDLLRYHRLLDPAAGISECAYAMQFLRVESLSLRGEFGDARDEIERLRGWLAARDPSRPPPRLAEDSPPEPRVPIASMESWLHFYEGRNALLSYAKSGGVPPHDRAREALEAALAGPASDELADSAQRYQIYLEVYLDGSRLSELFDRYRAQRESEGKSLEAERWLAHIAMRLATRGEPGSREKVRAISRRLEILAREIAELEKEKRTARNHRNEAAETQLTGWIESAAKEVEDLRALGQKELARNGMIADEIADASRRAAPFIQLAKLKTGSDHPLRAEAHYISGKLDLLRAETLGSAQHHRSAARDLEAARSILQAASCDPVPVDLADLLESLAIASQAADPGSDRAADAYEQAALEHAKRIGGAKDAQRCALLAVDCTRVSTRKRLGHGPEEVLESLKAAGVLSSDAAVLDSAAMYDELGAIYEGRRLFADAADRRQLAYDREPTPERCLEAAKAYISLWRYAEARKVLEDGAARWGQATEIQGRLETDVKPRLYLDLAREILPL